MISAMPVKMSDIRLLTVSGLQLCCGTQARRNSSAHLSLPREAEHKVQRTVQRLGGWNASGLLSCE
jgi:hypothetical protein